MQSLAYKKIIITLSILFFCLFAVPAHAGNPTTPITPNDNILDPGDPSTPWGGCTPTDSNCYVATPWTNTGDDIYYNGGNVGIGTDTPEAKLHVNGTLKVTGSSSLADITPETAASTTPGVVKNQVSASAYYGLGMAKGLDGFPRIAFFDNDTALIYAVCHDADCSDLSRTQVVSQTYGASPGSNIMTLGSDGFARIIYMDSNNILQFVRCENDNCDTMTINPIDENTANYPGYYGQQIVMGDDGFPRIVYSDYGDDYNDHFVRCLDEDCSSIVHSDLTGITSVSGDGSPYDEIAIAIGPDHFPRIIIPNAVDDYALTMLRCTDADCTNPVIDTIADGTNSPGSLGSDILIGSDGFARVVYVDGEDASTLHFLVCNDIDCTSPTITDLSDTDGYTENGIGLDLRIGNLASISYEDYNDDTVHIINCINASCSSSEDVQVDTLPYGMYGGGPLIIGDDGLPMMAYSDASTVVKFARLLNIDGSNITAGNDIGSVSTKFNRIYGQTINADHLVVNGSDIIGSQWTTTGSDIYFNGGNVGIGISDPVHPLSVEGNDAQGQGAIIKLSRATGGLEKDGYLGSAGNDYAYFSSEGALKFKTGVTANLPYSTGVDALYINSAGNVGIGTTNPRGKLEINNGGADVVFRSLPITGGNMSAMDLYTYGVADPFRITSLGRLIWNLNNGNGTRAITYDDTSLFLKVVTNNLTDTGTDSLGGLSLSGINGGYVTGINIAGGDISISGGRGTGTGNGGSIIFQTASSGASGSSLNSLTEKLRISSSGLVGIGTASPGNKLQINASSGAVSETLLRLSGGTIGFTGASDTGTAYSIIFDGPAYSPGTGIVIRDGAKIEMAKESTWNESDGGTVRGALVFYTGAGSVASPTLTEKLRISSSGFVGIGNPTPSVALDVTGDIEYTGTITDVSDMRLKENITDFSGGLDIINNIGVKNYNMIVSPDKPETGFIAQNVQQFFPQAVSVVDPTNGYLGVSYVSFVPVLAKGIQELDLNLNQIAGTNTLNTPASDAFTASFFENVFAKTATWMADTTNGITDFFANRVHTETLCVGKEGDETCITKAELDNLLQGQNTTPGDPTPPPSTTEPTPDTTTPTEDVTTPPDTQTPPDIQAPAPQESPSLEEAPVTTN